MSFTLPSAARLQRQVEAYRRDLLARAQYLPGEGFLHRHARVAEADARLPEEESQLGAELLGPWEASRKVRLLLIVPDGPLWSLPFDSLRIPIAGRVNLAGRDQSDRSLNPHTFQYALARFEIAEEPSASVLLSLIHRRRKIPAQSRVAIFADPVYSSIDPRVGGRAELARVKLSEGSSLRSPPTRWVAEAGMAELARLKGSRREALQIASLAGAGDSKVYLGFAAQPEAVKSMKWSRFRVAHFAAHAMVNSRNPALSGIVLTMISRTGAPEDGVLWLHNIYLLHMPVSLVVLSGCGTATGEDIPGEGVAGFARAFFFAGAQRVIGSLWSIEDEPTAALMRAFYVNLLKRGQSAAASLRAAQLAIAGTKGTDAPYFWAGFILQGLGR